QAYFIDVFDFAQIRDYISILSPKLFWGGMRSPNEEDMKRYENLWFVPERGLEQAFSAYEQNVRSILRRDLFLPVQNFLDDVHLYGEGRPGWRYGHEEDQNFPDPEDRKSV